MTQIQKCTLVPTRYFREEASRCILSDLYTLSDDEVIRHIAIPEYDAVMVYTEAGESLPELYHMIRDLGKCSEYNKILVSHVDGWLHLLIAQGNRLLLANSYRAEDFATAQYFVFFAMRSLQLNPEVSVISVRSELTDEMEMSLYRYFQSVEKI